VIKKTRRRGWSQSLLNEVKVSTAVKDIKVEGDKESQSLLNEVKVSTSPRMLIMQSAWPASQSLLNEVKVSTNRQHNNAGILFKCRNPF